MSQTLAGGFVRRGRRTITPETGVLPESRRQRPSWIATAAGKITTSENRSSERWRNQESGLVWFPQLKAG
jgi:hypothetical protein